MHFITAATAFEHAAMPRKNSCRLRYNPDIIFLVNDFNLYSHKDWLDCYYTIENLHLSSQIKFITMPCSVRNFTTSISVKFHVSNVILTHLTGRSSMMLPSYMGDKPPSDYASFSPPYGPQWTLTRLSMLIHQINCGIQKHSRNSQYITFVQVENSEKMSDRETFRLGQVGPLTRCRWRRVGDVIIVTDQFELGRREPHESR